MTSAPADVLARLRASPVRHVAGMMSGTSMDGLDIALCRIARGPPFAIELLAFDTVRYPAELAAELADEGAAGLDRIARLHQRLGRFCAEALAAFMAGREQRLDLVGSHGQTVYHEHGVTTLQLGEASEIAWRLGCPVVHDFRQNDIAAGGCGAPLVPYVDVKLLADPARARLAVNIGGIANFTAIPKAPVDLSRVVGMDCGPGNMVLDQLARVLSDGALACDRDGALAAQGVVREDLLSTLAGHRVFGAPPPKSVGREQFGHAYVESLLAIAPPRSEQDWCDLFATMAELTALGIHEAWRRFVQPVLPIEEVLVSGGGARNPEIMRRLARRFDPLPVRPSDDHGLSADAKEAIAFALLASERIDDRPTNLPTVTGARAAVRLGRITAC